MLKEGGSLLVVDGEVVIYPARRLPWNYRIMAQSLATVRDGRYRVSNLSP